MNENTTEFRIRKIANGKFDLVLMRHDTVEVRHNLSNVGVQDFLRAFYSSLMFNMPVGGSYNLKSLVKF